MNKAIFYLLLIAALGAVVFFFTREREAGEALSTSGPEDSTVVSPPLDTGAASPDVGHTTSQAGTPIPREKLLSPEDAERALQEVIDSMPQGDKQAKPDDVPMEWWAMLANRFYQQRDQNGEIEFYGMVVDDQGLPLPDVTIRASVNTYYASMAEWHAARRESTTFSTDLDLTTDPGGRFSVDAMTGTHLVFLAFNIEGYSIEEGTQNGFKFVPDDAPPYSDGRKRHEPDPENPVVFVMRRVQD